MAVAQRTIAGIEAELEALLGPGQLDLVHRALRRIIADAGGVENATHMDERES